MNQTEIEKKKMDEIDPPSKKHCVNKRRDLIRNKASLMQGDRRQHWQKTTLRFIILKLLKM